MQNNNVYGVNMTARFLSAAAFRPAQKDMQSIDSEEGEKIISRLRNCHRSEEDKEHGWHWVFNIFYVLLGEVSPPVHMCVGETGVSCEKLEKINKKTVRSH